MNASGSSTNHKSSRDANAVTDVIAVRIAHIALDREILSEAV